MRLLRPDLWWVPVAIVIGIVAVRRLTKRRALAMSTVALLLDPSYRAPAWRHLPFVVATGALVLALAGLLQPVLPVVQREVRIQGLDIVLAIDLSLSMTQPIGGDSATAERSTPRLSRIEAVKQALKMFIERRPGDRIGVVVFSDNSYVVSPLTVDHDHLLGYFNLIDPTMLVGEGRTAIGDGIDTGMSLLRRQSTSERRNKVLMIFTDGASNSGRSPIQSLDDATRAGTRVHLVGVDLEQEIRQSPQAGKFIEAVRGRGGRYYAAESAAALDEAARSLDELERGEVRTRAYVRNEPLVEWFAIPALVLLLITVGLRAMPVFLGVH
jgi:Ca-activated chloride channel family protein